jgi:hypothetical protein
VNENTEFYVTATRKEIERLEQGKFTGNVEFQFNFKEGAVANQNITLRKSLKRIE